MKCRMGVLTAVLLLGSSAATVRAQTAAGSPSSQQPTEVTPLEPGKPIERELAGDQAHSYSITLTAGQYLHIVVEQKGIDVVVMLFGPDGKKVAEVNSPNGTQGPGPVSFIAEAAGTHRLEVRSPEKTAAAGRYELKVEELRTATEQDKSRIAAKEAFAQAVLLRGQGIRESLQSAIKKYEESLPLFRAVGDRRSEANTLNNIGEVYDRLGEKQKAFEFQGQALQVYREIGDKSGEVLTIEKLTDRYYSLDKNEKQKAINALTTLLVLIHAVGNRELEGYLLVGIAYIYRDLGEYQKALDRLNQALPLTRASGNVLGEAYALSHIGAVYLDFGELRKAIEYFNKALPLFQAHGDRAGETYALAASGTIYRDLGEYEKSLDYYKQALALLRATHSTAEAMALVLIGGVYYRIDEPRKALEYVNQGLLLSRATGAKRAEQMALKGTGFIYLELGEPQKALGFFEQALPLQRADGGRYFEAEILGGIARAHNDLDNNGAALTHIEAALAIIESYRSNIASQEMRSSYFAMWQSLYEFYINLLMRLHQQRPANGYDGAALQASERARARGLIELLTEARADIRQGVDSALLERQRSLQRQLNAAAHREMLLRSSKDSGEQADIMKEIGKIESEYQDVQTQIRIKSPRYAALTQPQPLNLKEIQDSLDADTLLLEYSLGAERSYLWAVTPTNISSYELPKREVIETVAKRVYQSLNARNQFIKGETKAQQQARITQADVDYPAAAKQLSQMVLAPVATHLGRKRLLIVSDGALQFIPFAALPDPYPTRAGRAEPLVVSHELVSLPSASTLAVLRREQKDRKPATKLLAVLADPVFARDDERVKIKLNERSSTNSKPEDSITQTPQASGAKAALANESRATTETYGSRQLVKEQLAKSVQESNATDAELRIARLPGSRREAMQIMALIPGRQGKLALDFAASRTTALSNDLSDYRYVHFATHGLLNSTHPELSGIVFSLVDDKGEPEDGFLRAHEVFNLKLSADLVVLSACQTGLGKEVRGEGLISLTRGFMYAGAPRVVVSLWSVDDEATASLMVGFYKAMLSGKMSPAAALRAAQIEVRKQKQLTNPYYWAAFTIQGEWR